MKHSIKHSLSDELAKKATSKAFESYRERFAEYNPVVDWIRDDRADISFKAKGIKLDGNVQLKPGEI